MAAPLCTVVRDNRGRFSTDKAAIREKRDNVRRKRVKQNIILEHNYSIGHIHDDVCNFNGCEDCCPGYSRLLNSKKIKTEEWKEGRRVIEWRCLIDSLSHCLVCKMGPLQLTYENIKGEMKMGLGGYLYIQCSNCGQLNNVPYGSTYTKPSTRGQKIFTVNTKLGAGNFIMFLILYRML